MSFESLQQNIQACQLCSEHLPHGTRPVLQAHPDAKILIIGQAPGRKVHDTGIPFNDASGDRLREWLGLDKDTFYQPRKIAIMPMGFCYPGTGKSGDLPPRKECAPLWHPQLLDQFKHVKLTLLIGQYAQQRYLNNKPHPLTDTVKRWNHWGEHIIPLPHPSPRNNIWLNKNPWFEQEVLPYLQQQVRMLLTHQTI